MLVPDLVLIHVLDLPDVLILALVLFSPSSFSFARHAGVAPGSAVPSVLRVAIGVLTLDIFYLWFVVFVVLVLVFDERTEHPVSGFSDLI